MRSESTKHQQPSSREAPSTKLQTARRLNGARCLVFLWMLGVEIWGFGPPAVAAPNEQKEIQELYARALQGDKAAVEQCIEKLEAVSQREPSNQLARVYLGSAYTLRSRDLGFGPKKLSTLKRGLAVMDEAVAAAPNEPKVRLARALTTSALPAIFGRREESRNDFAVLAKEAERAPERFDRGELAAIREHASSA